MTSAAAIACSMAVSMLLINIRHGARSVSLALWHNRLDAETFGRLAALPCVNHCRIGRLDVAGQAWGVEQRVAQSVLRQPLAQRAKQHWIARKLLSKRLVFL